MNEFGHSQESDNIKQFYHILLIHKEFISEETFNACIADLKEWIKNNE